MTMNERTRAQNKSFARLARQENERRGGCFSAWADAATQIKLWFRAWAPPARANSPKMPALQRGGYFSAWPGAATQIKLWFKAWRC